MKLALYQFSPQFGDLGANVERMAAALRREAADLWILPELSGAGYLFEDREECRALAEAIPGPTTEVLARVCAERSTRVIVGLGERAGGRLYNSSVYVDPGGVVAVYRKIHLFDREKLLFDPGPDPFAVHPLGERRVGMMICFDWIFPEAARSLALQGAELLAHGANLVLPWGQSAMVTRALENGVFAATCNRIGTEARAGAALTFTGRSQIVGPQGELLAQAGPDTEEILTAEVDLARAARKAVNARNDRFGDRRPDLYRC